MVNITLYNASIPHFKTGLAVLSRILAKAALHFPDSPDSILTATLIEGMLPCQATSCSSPTSPRSRSRAWPGSQSTCGPTMRIRWRS
ncbi:hypothetical protein CCHR01_17479 [Colletotrichum chrysophilum]|uniref:Uncharacterized protein n=1 Tax=Colletotrichum chrysophilum TaxID=1836956 RepID=A0AAD9A6H3_9PEZI|nr:hypothetical protein CCHR01_17479 [Colletotrichum chrysophilum]